MAVPSLGLAPGESSLLQAGRRGTQWDSRGWSRHRRSPCVSAEGTTPECGLGQGPCGRHEGSPERAGGPGAAGAGARAAPGALGHTAAPPHVTGPWLSCRRPVTLPKWHSVAEPDLEQVSPGQLLGDCCITSQAPEGEEGAGPGCERALSRGMRKSGTARQGTAWGRAGGRGTRQRASDPAWALADGELAPPSPHLPGRLCQRTACDTNSSCPPAPASCSSVALWCQEQAEARGGWCRRYCFLRQHLSLEHLHIVPPTLSWLTREQKKPRVARGVGAGPREGRGGRRGEPVGSRSPHRCGRLSWPPSGSVGVRLRTWMSFLSGSAQSPAGHLGGRPGSWLGPTAQ